MKIFFDARYTRTDYHDGISRYSAELGNALAKLTPVTFLISDEAQKQWFPSDAQFIKIHPGTSIKEPFTAFILNKYKPDVVYSPMQTIGTMGRKYKSVLTPQDMIYYRHPQAPGFFWCVGQGGMGIQTAPAASLLCARLILDEPLGRALAGLNAADFVPRSFRS